VRDLKDGVLDWMIGFIDTLYIHNTGLQVIQRGTKSTVLAADNNFIM
jgi:hypothetical protein